MGAINNPIMNQTQLQQLTSSIDQKINLALQEFDNQNRLKTYDDWEVLQAAVNDPKWRQNVVSRAKAGRSWDCRQQIVDSSPKAKALVCGSDSKLKTIKANRQKLHQRLIERKQELIDWAVIGEALPLQVLQRVRNFC